jgi:hypothetical protein
MVSISMADAIEIFTTKDRERTDALEFLSGRAPMCLTKLDSHSTQGYRERSAHVKGKKKSAASRPVATRFRLRVR